MAVSNRNFSLVLLFVLGFAPRAFPSAHKDTSINPYGAVGAIDLLSSQMDEQVSLVEAKHKLVDDQERSKIQDELHSQVEQAYSQRAVSEEDYRKSLSDRDQARYQVDESAAGVREAGQWVEIYAQSAKRMVGLKIPTQETIQHYAELWKARYDGAEAACARTEAALSYQSFHLSLIERLQAGAAASTEDLLNARKSAADASFQFKLAQSRSTQAKCFWGELTQAAQVSDFRMVDPRKCLAD